MSEPGPFRPLAIRFGAFGDMVQITALLWRLHERFGQPVDVVSSGAWTRPLLAPLPCVGDIVTLRSRRAPYWLAHDQQTLVRELRARPRGPVWYCDDGPLGRHLLERAGIDAGWIVEGRQLPWSMHESQVWRWLRLADLSPALLEDRWRELPPRPTHANAVLGIRPAERAAFDAWLAAHDLLGRRFVAIQAGNKRTMRVPLWRRRRSNSKYWPEERWGEVIREVRAALPDHAILLLGVPQELRMNEDIAAAARSTDVHNVAADLPVPVLLPLLERSHSLISVDTGPAHAAAALGCPTVALFGTANPIVNRPGGATTPAATLVGQVEGQPHILGITAREVVEAWCALCAIHVPANRGDAVTSWRERPAPALSA